MHRTTLTILFFSCALVACTDSAAPDSATGEDFKLGCCHSEADCCNSEPGESGVPGQPLAPITADVSIDVVGAGLAIGLDPACGLTLATEFTASASGTVEYDDTGWAVVDIEPAVSISVGNGCACTGISVQTIASVDIHAELAATAATCQSYCGGETACMDLCLQPGNILTASASLGASVDVNIGGALDLEGLVGEVIQLGNWVLCNAAGVAI